MKAWQIPLWGLACLLAAGCRTDPEITALQRENRYLEDRVYDLQDEADRAKQDLEKCRSGKQAQRDKTAPVSTQIETSKGGARSPRAGGLELNPPGTSSPSGEADDGLPKIIVETPKESLPPGEIPDRFKPGLPSPKTSPQSLPKPKSESSSGEAPKFSPGLDPSRGSTPAPGGEPLPEPNAPTRPGSERLNPSGGASANQKTSQSVGPAVPAADFRPPPAARHASPAQSVIPVSGITMPPRTDSAQVDRITLNHLVAAGWESDGRPGDDGICLLIEPRDAQGRMIAAAGPLSVVLLDRGLPGEAARVARWDLAAHQAAAYFRRMPAGDGIYLELPWPKAPPVHSHLHLFVRFTTRDGRNLEATREVDITLANQSRASRTGILPVVSPNTGGSAVPPIDGSAGRADATQPRMVPILAPPEVAGTWKATRLPPENLDERRPGETPSPLTRTGETPVPPTLPGDDDPPIQEVPYAPAGTDILPMPDRRAGETPAPLSRPVWSPNRR